MKTGVGRSGDLASLGRIVTFVLALIGVLPRDFKALGPGRALLFAGVVVLVAFLLLMEFRDWRRNREKAFPPNNPAIATYLCDWLQRGGTAAIFSRDLSWVKHGDSEEMLRQKAAADELVLCLPRATDLSNRLKGAGARVYTYEWLNYTPLSRFTIINFERGGARVTAGAAIGDEHVVREYSSDEDPFYWIAQDLVSIVRETSRHHEAQAGGVHA